MCHWNEALIKGHILEFNLTQNKGGLHFKHWKHLGLAACWKIGLLEISTDYKYWNSSGQAVINNLKKRVWGRCHFNFTLTDLLNVNLVRHVIAKWNNVFVPLLHKISLGYSCFTCSLLQTRSTVL